MPLSARQSKFKRSSSSKTPKAVKAIQELKLQKAREQNARDGQVLQTVKHWVRYVLDQPDSCPRYLIYSDEFLTRAHEAQGYPQRVKLEIQEHMQCDLLFFLILRHLQGIPEGFYQVESGQACLKRHESLFFSLEERIQRHESLFCSREGGGALWRVLDDVVAKDLQAASKEDQQRARPHAMCGREGEDECWREFWEHFRTGSAKTTKVQVASLRAACGGRFATKGSFPSISERILQESEMFAPTEESDFENLPQSILTSRLQRVRMVAAIEMRERDQHQFMSCGIALEGNEFTVGARTPRSSKGFNRAGLASRGSSKGFSGSKGFSNVSSGSASRTGTPQHTRNRALSRGGEGWLTLDGSDTMPIRRPSTGSARGGKRPSGSGGGKRPSGSGVTLPVLVPKLSLNPAEGPTRGPVLKFTGWRDYKIRNEAVKSLLGGQTHDLVQSASTKPQREVSVALLEHRAVVEWRVGNDFAESKQHCFTGALSARSRRCHLPPIGRQSHHKDGSQTDRSNLRSPPAAFRRPWSREERAPRWNTKKVHNSISVEELSGIERYAKICRNTGIHPQADSVRFLVKMPSKLSIRSAGFSDDDLFALIAALPRDGSIMIDAFDIGENPRLTDASACEVLQAVASGVLGLLQVLHLDHCRHFGRDTIHLCTEMLLSHTPKVSLREVRILSLSGVTIALQEYLDLAHAVQIHPHLQDVRLAETGLGRTDKAHASRVITMLIGSEHLQALDLSWNILDTAAFQVLGRGLAEHKSLASLGLANACGASDCHGCSPLLVFLEQLSADANLTSMDISHNNLDEGAGLVLESACRKHPAMHRINISNNPLGSAGKRSLLRLLACEECPKFTELICEDCFASGVGMNLNCPFDGDPSGRYTIDLEHPIRRAFLRLLLLRCAEGPEAIPLPKLMQSAKHKHAGKEKPLNFNLIELGDNGQWKLPTYGELTFDLCASEVVLGNEQDLLDELAVAKRIELMATRSKLVLKGGTKTVAVLSQARKAKTVSEMNSMLLAISADFTLSPEQVQALCITRLPHALCGPAHILCKLLPCLPGMDQLREGSSCTRTLYDLYRLHKGGSLLLSLNLENPTGHYVLSLSESTHYAVAQRLLLLNRWELHLWKAAARPDISQSGNGKNFRNAKVGDASWQMGNEEWRLPNDDTLSFDYTSLRRPPESAQPLNDDIFQALLRSVYDAKADHGVELLRDRFADVHQDKEDVCDSHSFDKEVEAMIEDSTRRDAFSGTLPPSLRRMKTPRSIFTQAYNTSSSEDSSGSDISEMPGESARRRQHHVNLRASAQGQLSEVNIVRVLWSLSPHFYILCRQFRELLCALASQEAKRDAVISLFSRVIDWPMNLSKCRAKLNDQMWRECKERAGYLNMFPIFQPENYFGSLDMSVNEQRRVVHLILTLWQGEHPRNLRNPKIDWAGPRPTPEFQDFVSGVPPKWVEWEELPCRGEFRFSYDCSKDNMKLKLRRKLAVTVCGYTAIPELEADLRKQVKFWTVLDDVPEAVHHFIYFLVCTCKDLKEAFKKIDENRDGDLSLKEWLAGCYQLGFRLAGMSKQSVQPVRSSIAVAHSAQSISVIPKVIQCEDNHERVVQVLTSVYRFLDPNGDGNISLREFLALDGMWRELKQTMWEFVAHLLEMFGSLEAAWDNSDIDHDGTIDMDEFLKLAKDWKFDGPVLQVYLWIDMDGAGQISKKEWLMLEKITRPTW